MKSARFIKSVGFFLLIIFALQVTDVTCYGEDLSFVTPVQSEHQLKAVDSNNKDITDSSSSIIGHCQCPCHLSFSLVPGASIISCLLIGIPLNISDYFSIQKVSTDIFQPPKISL